MEYDQRPNSKDAHDRILGMAANLFARFGYNGISTREIAVQARVNEVTIYRRYGRKRNLYCAALESELRKVQLRGDLLAQLAEASDGPTALHRAFDLIAATLGPAPHFLRLVQFSTNELSEDVDLLLRKYLREQVEVIAGYLRPWISRGDLQCTNPRALVMLLAIIAFSDHSLRRVFSEEIPFATAILDVYKQSGGIGHGLMRAQSEGIKK